MIYLLPEKTHMNDRIASRSFVLAALVSISTLFPTNSDATVVTFQTVMGDIEVNLYDNATPQTVANFLAYVNDGNYSASVFHRSDSGFIIQGGGFTFDMAIPLDEIEKRESVTNEPDFSNVRGTIAMAKLGGQPDSATSQWFFNLADNSGNLDSQNGGFTVFGQVTGSGMDVVDDIAALPTYDFGSPFNDIPLRDYSAADFNNQVPVEEEHLILITAIIVTDPMVDTVAGLNMPLSTANNGGGGLGGGGGGGNFSIWAVLLLLATLLGQRLARERSGIRIGNSVSKK
jgi:peptidyl-prolyl cis-trans isomerase A (cyclophilin A)